MNRFRFQTRRIARQALVNVLPAPSSPEKVIAITGLPRSGTSWTAKVLALSDRVSYYFEPELVLGSEFRYIYIEPDKKNAPLYENINQTIRGRITDEYTICEHGLKEILTRSFRDRVLIKWVRLSLSLDWIASSFPGVKLIQIIRHPVPLFLSWDRKNWDPSYALNQLLDQETLMAGPLKKYKDIMEGAGSYWEKAAAFWCAVTYMKLLCHRKDWLFIEHEWLCLDPVPRFKWLADKIGFPWNDRMEEFLSPQRRIESGPGYGKSRDSGKEVHKWEKKIRANELREIQWVMDQFGLPFYKNLDPEQCCTEALNGGGER